GLSAEEANDFLDSFIMSAHIVGADNGLRYALSYLAKQDQKEHGIILMRSRLPEKSNRGRPRHN
ncbi:hypothetical protein A8F87_25710, partial [Escherichia coli]|uniref:hypothetical protein n=1 Tax=Escherichia coli TaxID=562 RepID=UPI000B43EB28